MGHWMERYLNDDQLEAFRDQQSDDREEFEQNQEGAPPLKFGPGGELCNLVAEKLRAQTVPLLDSESFDLAEQILSLCGIEPGKECESGLESCGPVTMSDSEGVPLCTRCFLALSRRQFLEPLLHPEHEPAHDREPLIGDGTEAVLAEFLPWALATFPDSTPKSCAAHLRKEAEELLVNPLDRGEVADVLFLAFDLCQRAGFKPAEVMREKLAEVRTRTWGEPDADGVVEHVREPLVGEDLARMIDATPWPELTGDADASAFVERLEHESAADRRERQSARFEDRDGKVEGVDR